MPMDNLAKEKGLFATDLRVLSGGHVISGSRQSTLNAFSIMSINPARACLAGMILMITGVLVRNWNASHRVPLRGNENGVTGNSAQAYVRWYQNERRKYGVSTGFPLIFPTVTSVMKSHLRVRNASWSSPYLIVDFLPSLYYEQKYRTRYPILQPYKTFDIVSGI